MSGHAGNTSQHESSERLPAFDSGGLLSGKTLSVLMFGAVLGIIGLTSLLVVAHYQDARQGQMQSLFGG